MPGTTTIGIYGAYGYTGRLVAAELARSDLDALLIGRDATRLRETADTNGDRARIAVAGLDDRPKLIAALRECDVVINCAGPFALHGDVVLEAAIAAGCDYLDTTGEQAWVKRAVDRYAEAAERAGVTAVPAAAKDGL